MDLLRIEDLHVEVGGKEIIKGVDLSIQEGELHVLFGPNGSGKSTLIKSIMGFSDYMVTGGSILFHGQEIKDLTIDERANLGLGIALQHPPPLKGISLRSLLEITLGGEVDDDLVRMMDLNKIIDREANVGFSGGELKRAELAQIVSMRYDLTLMDEPESGVDLENIYLVAKAIETVVERGDQFVQLPIRERKKSALMITHTGEVLEYLNADKGHVLVNGVIGCSGNPIEILKKIRKVGYEGCLICPTCD
jgi:Fe-S cluster assembly ATP-binding protein